MAKSKFRVGQVVNLKFPHEANSHFALIIRKEDEEWYRYDLAGLRGPIHYSNLRPLTAREIGHRRKEKSK